MNLRSFDLNLLRVLDAMIIEKSTTLAGKRIGLSQPAVSAALGRLRASLGDPLFVRHGQRLEPTIYARSLELPLREIFNGLENLLSGPEKFNPTTAKTSFKLFGSDIFSELLFPRLADHLQMRAPGIFIQMVDGVGADLSANGDDFSIDLALLPVTESPEWSEYQPLFNSSLAIIARTGHPRLAEKRILPGDVIPLELLGSFSHVNIASHKNLNFLEKDILNALGRNRKIGISMPNFHGVSRVVMESDHVALVPQQLAHALSDNQNVEVFLTPMPIQVSQFGMVWHKKTTSSAAHKWLRTLIAELMEPLGVNELPITAT